MALPFLEFTQIKVKATGRKLNHSYFAINKFYKYCTKSADIVKQRSKTKMDIQKLDRKEKGRNQTKTVKIIWI